jgi:hypothetical protein
VQQPVQVHKGQIGQGAVHVRSERAVQQGDLGERDGNTETPVSGRIASAAAVGRAESAKAPPVAWSRVLREMVGPRIGLASIFEISNIVLYFVPRR